MSRIVSYITGGNDVDFRVQCRGVTHEELEQEGRSLRKLKYLAFMYIFLFPCRLKYPCTCILEVEVDLSCLPSPYLLS